MKRQRNFVAQCRDELRKEEHPFWCHIANQSRSIMLIKLRTVCDCGHMKGNTNGVSLVVFWLAHYCVCTPATCFHGLCSHAPDLRQTASQTKLLETRELS